MLSRRVKLWWIGFQMWRWKQFPARNNIVAVAVLKAALTEGMPYKSACMLSLKVGMVLIGEHHLSDLDDEIGKRYPSGVLTDPPQSEADHDAMNVVRSLNGDVQLIWGIVGGSTDTPPRPTFECVLCQGRASASHPDPAKAIVDAYLKMTRES